jgi:hypothetical protein
MKRAEVRGATDEVGEQERVSLAARPIEIVEKPYRRSFAIT